MRIRDLQVDAHANAVEKGFWDTVIEIDQGGSKAIADALWAPKVALIHAEVRKL